MSRFLKSFFSLPKNSGTLLMLPILLVITEVVFKPWFPGYIGVGYEWFWFFVFFFGYACIVAKDQYYNFIEKQRI